MMFEGQRHIAIVSDAINPEDPWGDPVMIAVLEDLGLTRDQVFYRVHEGYTFLYLKNGTRSGVSRGEIARGRNWVK